MANVLKSRVVSSWRSFQADTTQRAIQVAGAGDEARVSQQVLGIRGVAAMGTLVAHCWFMALSRNTYRIEDLLPQMDGTLPVSLAGVIGIFYTITGFALYGRWIKNWQAGTTVSTSAYFIRRAGRIIPLYWVTLAVGIGILYFASKGQEQLWPVFSSIWPHVFFLQNYFESTYLTLSMVSYTLAIDVAFYVALPFIGFFTSRLRSFGQQWMLLAVLMGIAVAWRVLALSSPAFYYAGETSNYTLTFSLLWYLPFFVVGMGCRLLVAKPPKIKLTPFVTVVFIVFETALWFASGLNETYGSLYFTFLNSFIAGSIASFVLVTGRGFALEMLRSQPLLLLGVLSYGVFLWQIPVLFALRATDMIHTGFLGTLAITLPITLLLSAITFVMIERPSVRISHDWARRVERTSIVKGPYMTEDELEAVGNKQL